MKRIAELRRMKADRERAGKMFAGADGMGLGLGLKRTESGTSCT